MASESKEVNNEPAQAIQNKRTAKDVQQNFAESSGYSTYVIWDLLSAAQNDVLECKIQQLIPDQEKGQNSINTARQTLFDSIWAQRKYTNRNSLSSIIYVLVTKVDDLNSAEESTVFSCHPVFRTRRCTAVNSSGSNSSECCMIFIDEFGRVYQNWKSYTEENTLPEGVMIAPINGIYCLDEFGKVQLTRDWTPASSTASKVLGVADTSSAVGGFLAACVPLAALTLPVTAPLLAVAGGVGLAAAGYSAARSGAQLYDRSQHEQSISITDRQARGSWLGVMGGLVGLGATGATTKLAVTAAAGKEVGLAVKCAVNGLNITSIILSGSGVAHGVFELYLKHQDDDTISSLDIVQLAASLALFTHSMYNFKLASSIVSESQNRTIGQIRENLSNRQRRMFDKMSKETIRIRGATKGKMDIIRGVNEVPSRQQLNDVFKINKQLNQRGVRPAFAPEGKGILLNNEVVVNSGDLRSSVQHNIGPDVLGKVTQPIPESFQSSSDGRQVFRSNNILNQQLLFKDSEGNMMHESTSSDWASGVRALSNKWVPVNGVLISLSQFGITIFKNINNAEGFEDVISRMAEIFNEEIFCFILNLTRTFLETMLEEILEVLGFCIATETVLYRMVKHILETYTFEAVEHLEEFTLAIIAKLREYFLSFNPNSSGGPQKCNVCSGFFTICDL